MGIFDELTGSRPANPDVVPIGAAELRQALRKLNRDDLAWRVEGSDESAVELVAMWKFDDPRWSARLNEASMLPGFHTRLGITPGLRVRLRLHEDVHVVRSLDEDVEFSAHAGLKGFSVEGSYGAGQLVACGERSSQLPSGLGWPRCG